ncbi:MFS transporter [Cellulomonas sp. P22]|uniref:MFS transporter n=1 Tax=Cellulomonas sp. P22 TaxID=3373189 RepID=UPI0037AFBF83
MTSEVTTPTSASARVGPRTWTALVVLGLVGQLAWTVENMYLNVFVYDTITDDPTVLAGMVAASAIVATVTTLLVGSFSDRVGNRRGFIAVGYVLWGLSTAAFGFVTVDGVEGAAAAGSAVTAAVVAVVLLDCLMTLFGSGANDAAFNAWVTDTTVPANRGRVDSVLAIMPLLAMLLVFGALDPLTQDGRWRVFFGVVGLITALIGVYAWFAVRDAPTRQVQSDGYLRAVLHGLRPAVVRASPQLYALLLVWVVVATCIQVFLPYLIIYIQRYLQIDGYAIVLAVVLTVASVLSVLGGRVMDRVGKLRFLPWAVGVLAAGLVLMFFARGMAGVILAGIVMMAGFLLSVATISALVRDETPEGRAGNVQGLRMIAAVLVPMVVGPFLGAAVIRGADETYVDLGLVKQVPTPWIFLAAAAVLVLVVPAVRLVRKHAVR